MGIDAAHQVLEVFEVGDFMRLLVRELRDHVARAGARHLPRIDSLQRATARTRTGNGIDSILTTAVHGNCPSR